MKTVSRKQLVHTYAPAVTILIAILIITNHFQIDMYLVTRDVAAIAKIHPLSGFLSSLGILLWSVAAVVCLFTAFVLYQLKSADSFWFLLFSAIFSAYFMFDDLFQFHERLAQWYLGINQKLVFVLLGLAFASYLFAFRKQIWLSNYLILAVAIGFLATSVVIDLTATLWSQPDSYWRPFFEDGAKWLGIASWSSYFVHTCNHLICETFENRVHSGT